MSSIVSRIRVYEVLPALLLMMMPVLAQEPKSDVSLPRDTRSDTVKADQDLEQAIRDLKARVQELEKLTNELKAKSSAKDSAVVNSDPSRSALTADRDTKPDVAVAPLSTEPPKTVNTTQAGGAVLMAGWDGDHAVLRSRDGSFVTNVTGYAQFDFHGYEHKGHPPDNFFIRRARLALQGKLDQYYEFKIEGDFADTSSAVLRDLYVRIHRWDEVQFSFGQFKEPYSQEEIRLDAFNDFVERSLVNNLVPSRSPGLMISGDIGHGVLQYQAGVFNAKGVLAQNNNSTPESAIRLRLTPFSKSEQVWVNRFAFGGTYAQGRNIGGTSIKGSDESRTITFFAAEPVSGKVTRINSEVSWFVGPASFRAEFDRTLQDRIGLGTKGANLAPVSASGYTGQFTYLLTGETKPEEGSVAPKRNVFTGERGIGAIELKARYSWLGIGDGVKSNTASSVMFGGNWYLTRFVRYMIDAGFEQFGNPSLLPKGSSRQFFVVLSRVQVIF